MTGLGTFGPGLSSTARPSSRDDDVSEAEGAYHLIGSIGPCPECGQALRPVSNGETANLLCPTCGICWHDELGWVGRVDPHTCPGCAWRGICAGAARTYGSAASG